MAGKYLGEANFLFAGDKKYCQLHKGFARLCLGILIEYASFRELQIARRLFKRGDGLEVECEISHGLYKVKMYYPIGGGSKKITPNTGVIYWEEAFDPSYDSGSTPWNEHSVVFDAQDQEGNAPDPDTFAASKTVAYEIGETDLLGDPIYADNPKIVANYAFLESIGARVDPDRKYTAHIPHSYDLVGQATRPPMVDPETQLAVVCHEGSVYFGGVRLLDDAFTNGNVAIYNGQMYQLEVISYHAYIYTKTLSEEDWTYVGELPSYATDQGWYNNWSYALNDQYPTIVWHPTEPRVTRRIVMANQSYTDSLKTAEEILCGARAFWQVISEYYLDTEGSWQATHYEYLYAEPYSKLDYDDTSFYTHSAYEAHDGRNVTVDTQTAYFCACDPQYLCQVQVNACTNAYKSDFSYTSYSNRESNYSYDATVNCTGFSTTRSNRGYCVVDFGYTRDGTFYIIGATSTFSRSYSGYNITTSITAKMTEERTVTAVYPATNCGCDYPTADIDTTYTQEVHANCKQVMPTIEYTRSGSNSLVGLVGPVFSMPNHMTYTITTGNAGYVKNVFIQDPVGHPFDGHMRLTYEEHYDAEYLDVDISYHRRAYPELWQTINLYNSLIAEPTYKFFYAGDSSNETIYGYWPGYTSSDSHSTAELTDSIVGQVLYESDTTTNSIGGSESYIKSYTSVETVTQLDADIFGAAQSNAASHVYSNTTGSYPVNTAFSTSPFGFFHMSTFLDMGYGVGCFKYEPWDPVLYYQRTTNAVITDPRTGWMYGSTYNTLNTNTPPYYYTRWRGELVTNTIDYAEQISIPESSGSWSLNYYEHNPKLM